VEDLLLEAAVEEKAEVEAVEKVVEVVERLEKDGKQDVQFITRDGCLPKEKK
jgi:hypothetical protein